MGKGMWVAKLCSNKILQHSTAGACRLTQVDLFNGYKMDIVVLTLFTAICTNTYTACFCCDYNSAVNNCMYNK